MSRNGLRFQTMATCASAKLVSDCKTFTINAFSWVQNLFQSQSELRSNNNGVCFHANNFGQFCRNVLAAFNYNFDCYTSIALLIFFACPTAVFWFVTLIVVNAVKRVFSRPWPHISNKIAEPIRFFFPTITHINPSSSVINPLLDSWIVATSQHALPHAVQRMRVLKRHGHSYN